MIYPVIRLCLSFLSTNIYSGYIEYFCTDVVTGMKQQALPISFYFRCYTVQVVELLNYYTNYCTYIKFVKFKH